jgi:ribosomal protein S18 acetylase RimI-like enzyme
MHPLIQTLRIENEPGRQLALAVMRAIYRDEKNWVQDDEKLVAAAEITDPNISWFVVTSDGRPAGVVRVLFEPPQDLYETYGMKFLDEGTDLKTLLRHGRIAEIGRFAVLPDHRRSVLVAVALMRAAARETVQREFTHYITDVFEGERHSPYDFHPRGMGFRLIATHDTGELNCSNRRLTMLLDIQAGYQHLRQEKSWAFRYLTEGWEPELHARMARPAPAVTAPEAVPAPL